MTSLALSGNHIESGWEHLRLLHQLRELDLSVCDLVELPEALEHMERTGRLKLGRNPIQRGWEQLRPLHQLREVHLCRCRITELPASLVVMESVTCLDLRDNPIERGWEHLPPDAPAGAEGGSGRGTYARGTQGADKFDKISLLLRVRTFNSFPLLLLRIGALIGTISKPYCNAMLLPLAVTAVLCQRRGRGHRPLSLAAACLGGCAAFMCILSGGKGQAP